MLPYYPKEIFKKVEELYMIRHNLLNQKSI